VQVWESDNIPFAAFKESQVAFFFRKINDHLWTARYLSLVGSNDKAENVLEKIFEDLKLAPTKPWYKKSSNAEKQILTDLQVESLHVLSSQINFETKRYKEAIANSQTALTLPSVSPVWRDRLNWNIGMFHYVNNNFDGAFQVWQAQLKETKDDALKPRAYFWLAKAAHQLKNEDSKQKYLQTLLTEYPLNYYTVVASQSSEFLANQWQQPFLDLNDLREKLDARIDEGKLAPFRKEITGTDRLLLRAEILVKARITSWARLALTDLDRNMRRYITFQEKNLALYVYLSRLYFANGNYVNAVTLNNEMSRVVANFWQTYPEQILVFFPQPFAAVYAKHAADTSVSTELLMAISRQESTFSADIQSGVGAIGLMQLMPHRATQIAKDLALNLVPSKVESQLRDPDFNIQMGSNYLKELKVDFNGFEPAIFGAYNAGDYPVRQWLKNRYAKDPVLWVELVTFGETKEYIKNVWRNLYVYSFLNSSTGNSLTFEL